MNSSLICSGNFRLSFDEVERFKKLIGEGVFQGHDLLGGVELLHVEDKNMIPYEIMEIVYQMYGTLKTFCAVRTSVGIPYHLHTEDCEIYFGGTGGTVVFCSKSGEETGRVELGKDAYSIVKRGDGHSLEMIDFGKPIVFFAVKFTIQEADQDGKGD